VGRPAPLVANPDGSPSDISRAHQIISPKPGWWDVTGGKLTTYRLMAEQTIDQLARHLERPAVRCRTADEPLLPEGETAVFSGVLPPEFGLEAVKHYLDREWAITLTDVMIRRSGWHYYHHDAAAKAEQVADWMAEIAGWSASQRAGELTAYHETVGQFTQPAVSSGRS
jgi:glycerol-3-phosphate dehydrogenase